MKQSFLLLAAFAAVLVPVCNAADNPWNGSWKLNAEKSKRTGSIDTLSQSPDGKYTVATSGITLSFACNGTEYPMPGGRTMSCTRVNPTMMHTVFKAGGDELAQVDRTLVDGGRTMSVVQTGKAADGTPFHDTEIYTKVAAGTGDVWTGKWQNTKVQTSSRGLAVVQASTGAITFTYPMSKSTLTAKLDGTPAQEKGPHPEKGLMVSMTAAGPLHIHEVDTLNGTVLEHDTLSVSADGKTMTVEVLRTGESTRQVYVYDKQ